MMYHLKKTFQKFFTNHQTKKNEFNFIFFENAHGSKIKILIHRIENDGFDINSSKNRTHDQIVQIFYSNIHRS